jgi:hypothetical protein
VKQAAAQQRTSRLSNESCLSELGLALATHPQVSADLGDGRYQVTGMKFNMPGWWVATLSVEGPDGPDTVTFNLVL